MVSDTRAVRRAIAHYDTHRGSQRSNSTAYKLALAEIRASANPMAQAEKLLRLLEGDRSRTDRKAIRGLVQGAKSVTFGDITVPGRAVTTSDVDALEWFLRGRYPGGRLDECHYRLLCLLEERVFAGTLTVSDFVDAGLAALQIEVWSPSRNAWVPASK